MNRYATYGRYFLALLTYAFSAGAFADAVEPWFSGEWDCRMTGRPTTMIWNVSLVPEGPCPNNNCPNDLLAMGWVYEANGTPTSLVRTSATNFDIQFAHASDNTPWYLVWDDLNRVANGYTTERGKRSPFTCRRKVKPVNPPEPPEPSPHCSSMRRRIELCNEP